MRSWIDLVEHACKTPGAFYSFTTSDDEIEASVELPPEVSLSTMSSEQGERLDDMLHDALEEIVAKIVAEIDDDADLHWDQARQNDAHSSEDSV